MQPKYESSCSFLYPQLVEYLTLAGTPHPVVADDPRFHGYLKPNAWTLCLGAGVSRDLAPDWFELTHRVVSHAFNLQLTDAEFKAVVEESGWTLDSWIQAAANEHASRGKTEADFRDLLESVLYSNIRAKANGLGIEKHLMNVLNFPHNAPRDRVIEVCDFIESTFSNCSLIQIADALIRAEEVDRGPNAVLTFNADTFLETYIDLRLRCNHYAEPGPHSHPNYPFVTVRRPSRGPRVKLPIIHCHGCIAPRWSNTSDPYDARDRLVFLESEYLAIGATRASWAETTFLYHAQSTKMVFVGMSMSDSNIRRWMSAVTIDSTKDPTIFNFKDVQNPKHIWIRPYPRNPLFQNLFLSSLQHIGVRPAWIPSWDKLGVSLRKLGAIH